MKHLLPCLLLLIVVTISAGDEPRLELTIARREIVQGDCQLLYVKFVNPTDHDVPLDGFFSVKCGGPRLELRYETGEFAHVSHMPASVARCGGRQVVKAQTSKAEFMYVGFDVIAKGEMTVFSRPGKYAIRALVHSNQQPIISEPQEFEVVDDGDPVVWPGGEGYWHRGVIYDPDRKLVSQLPLKSLLREHAELFFTMERYVEAPPAYAFAPSKEQKRWLGARKLAPPLVADAVGLKAAYRLSERKKYALALEEISRMTSLTSDAEAFRARCEQNLEKQRVRKYSR